MFRFFLCNGHVASAGLGKRYLKKLFIRDDDLFGRVWITCAHYSVFVSEFVWEPSNTFFVNFVSPWLRLYLVKKSLYSLFTH